MRIAIVAEPYIAIPPTQYGGIEQVIHYLIRGLKEAGHTPILLAPGDSKVDCELIPIVETALTFPRHKKDLPAHQKAVRRAQRKTSTILRSLLPSIDIIHSHGFDLSEFRTFPNLTTLHNKISLIPSKPSLRDVSYYMKRSDLWYVSISKNQQAVLPFLKYAGAIYNGEDPDEFPVVTKPDNYVCFLGRMDRDKNPHLAIELAISLKTKIKLAGKIDHEGDAYFETEIKPHLDHPLVEYLGELNFDDKVALISRAKCNLHPTNFREPFGLTVLEAAYCGTPTMAIARGSMPELIEPHRSGLLVEDFLEGSHLINQCYAMDRDYIASRSRQLFNYQSMAANYVEAYKTVIAAMPTITPIRTNLLRKLLPGSHFPFKATA